MKPLREQHPDVILMHNYSNGHCIYLHVCPLETPRFRFGLALLESFSSEEEATRAAVDVQRYLDAYVQYRSERASPLQSAK